ncbi:MAG: ABC transporter substrate-binding protein [Planctomyces sp.]|nr:ABC transporter substrate-binding protein [Planctomyces sp.]
MSPDSTLNCGRSYCIISLFAIFIVTTLPGCSQTTPPESDAASPKVQIALNWYPETEHGGFIAADAEGYYKQQGLDVEILPGDTNAPSLVISELAAGRIEFAVSDADNIVKARANDVPVVAILAPLQNTPRCIMVHEESGITRLEDLANVELAISEGRPFAQYLMLKLPLKNVTRVPYNGLVGEFMTKKSFAQQAFVFSEPFLAKEQGASPRALMVSEIGFNPYASVLVTTEKNILENPERVQRVVNAAWRGWKSYLDAPEKTNEAIGKMNSNMSAGALQYGADTMKDLCHSADGEPEFGMTQKRWVTLVEQIEEIGSMEKGAVRAEECFNDSFLKKAAAEFGKL